EAAWQAATDASEVLAPETGLFAGVDTADFGRSVLSVLARATTRPDQVGEAWLQFGNAMLRAWPVAAARWLGSDLEPPVPLDAKDRRFADPTWDGNPAFFALRQAYLATRRLGEELLAAGEGDAMADRKAQLIMGFLFDALSPTNFLLTNPAALKK